MCLFLFSASCSSNLVRVLIPTSGIRAGLWRSIDFWSIGSWFDDFLHKLLKILVFWRYGIKNFVQATVHENIWYFLLFIWCYFNPIRFYVHIFFGLVISLMSAALFHCFSPLSRSLNCSWANFFYCLFVPSFGSLCLFTIHRLAYLIV